MNKNVNYIRNRLSLRAPQETSLSILDSLFQTLAPHKNNQQNQQILLEQ